MPAILTIDLHGRKLPNALVVPCRHEATAFTPEIRIVSTHSSLVGDVRVSVGGDMDMARRELAELEIRTIGPLWTKRYPITYSLVVDGVEVESGECDEPPKKENHE